MRSDTTGRRWSGRRGCQSLGSSILFEKLAFPCQLLLSAHASQNIWPSQQCTVPARHPLHLPTSSAMARRASRALAKMMARSYLAPYHGCDPAACGYYPLPCLYCPYCSCSTRNKKDRGRPFSPLTSTLRDSSLPITASSLLFRSNISSDRTISRNPVYSPSCECACRVLREHIPAAG